MFTVRRLEIEFNHSANSIFESVGFKDSDEFVEYYTSRENFRVEDATDFDAESQFFILLSYMLDEKGKEEFDVALLGIYDWDFDEYEKIDSYSTAIDEFLKHSSDDLYISIFIKARNFIFNES